MTVTLQTPFNEYTGNDSTTEFAFTFRILRENQLTVSLDTVVQVSGFSVTGVDAAGGGTVTFDTPPATGVVVRLARATSPIRDTDYIEGGQLAAETLDDDQDYQTMLMQEINEFGLFQNAAGLWDFENRRLINVGDATDDTDALNRQTGDARYVNVTGDTMTGNLTMSSGSIIGPTDPTAGTHVGDRDYNDARYVEVAGDTMTGDLNMSNNDVNSATLMQASRFQSRTGSGATAGQLRFARTDEIHWRNQANSADLILGVDTSDNLEWEGIDVVLTTATQTLTAKTITLGGDLTLNGNNIIAVGPTTISSTEVSYLDGVSSNIQTQIDGKIGNVVEDTTPQLGGNLDVNGNSIVTLSNADVVIVPDGTGVISVTGTTNYEANVTADDDIPNKKYVDDQLATQNELGELTDVDLTGSPLPAVNDIIKFNGSNWVHGPEGTTTSLGTLSDVTITAAAKGDILVYNGSAWVDLTVGADTEILVADSAEATGLRWGAASSNTLAGLDDVDLTGSPLPANGDALVYDGANWVHGDAEPYVAIVATGTLPTSSGARTIAIGENARATANDAIAMGQNSLANDTQALAIGDSAQALDDRSTAIGDNSKCGSSASAGLAIGYGAYAKGTFTVSVGGNSDADVQGTAVGASAQATSLSAIAIGWGADAITSYRPIAIGEDAQATGQDSLAIGHNTAASNTDSMAVGHTTAVSGARTVAIGPNIGSISAADEVHIGNSTTNKIIKRSGGQVELNGTNAQFVLPNYTFAGSPVDQPTGTTGGLVFDTTLSEPKYYDGASWLTVGGINNVVEDITPQLGGDLDTNSFHIDFDDAHGIRDDSGNEQLIFQKTATAVNYLEITNAATGNDVTFAAVGDDANVGLDITPKGTGRVTVTQLEAPLPINTPALGSPEAYTTVLDDAEKMVEINNTGNMTVTIDDALAYPVGTKINIMQTGTGGTVTVGITGSPATLNVESSLTLVLAGQWAVATAFKRAADQWVLFGNLTAA